MRHVEQITQTHIKLDRGLRRLQRMLDNWDSEELSPETAAAIGESMENIRRRIERLIDSERAIGEHSENILGPGVLAEYRLISHHETLRTSIQAMLEALEEDVGDFVLEFNRFLALFEDYTEAERDFLATHMGVLYPGGATA